MGAKANSLASVLFFDGLSQERRASLEAGCRWRACQPGETIIHHLDSSDDVFFLVAGMARAIIYSDAGKAVAFRAIRAGDIFGELAAIDNKSRSAAIEAVEPCLVACMRRVVFWDTLRTENAFMVRVVEHLAKQIRDLTIRIYEFSTHAVSNRIHAELYRLAQEHIDAAGIARIRPIPRHGDIAGRVATTREAVAREFSHLTRLGVLQRTSSELLVLDLDRLAAMVHDATEFKD